jgi:hypothetical protein
VEIQASERFDSGFLLPFFNSVQGGIVQAEFQTASRATCCVDNRGKLSVMRLARAVPDGPAQLGDQGISGIALSDVPIPRQELLDETRCPFGKLGQAFLG